MFFFFGVATLDLWGGRYDYSYREYTFPDSGGSAFFVLGLNKLRSPTQKNKNEDSNDYNNSQ